MLELNRRNQTVPPHLRSTYPLEVMSRFFEDELEENNFRNSENFQPPQASKVSEKDTYIEYETV